MIMSALDIIILTALIVLLLLGTFIIFKEQIIELFKKVNCCHEWEKYYVTRTFGDSGDLPFEITHTLICKKCGKIIKRKV